MSFHVKLLVELSEEASSSALDSLAVSSGLLASGLLERANAEARPRTTV